VHDHDAVRALVERLTDGSTDLPADVAEVRIRAGAAFSPEALEQSYEMLTPGTPLEGSRLLVEPAQDECVCARCGSSWIPTISDLAGHVLLCPSCGAPLPIDDFASIEVLGISP